MALDTVRLQGNLSIDRSDPITTDTIYIPFYEGRLKFFANGTPFFDSDTQKYWQSGLRIPDALIQLPKTDGKHRPDISFFNRKQGNWFGHYVQNIFWTGNLNSPSLHSVTRFITKICVLHCGALKSSSLSF